MVKPKTAKDIFPSIARRQAPPRKGAPAAQPRSQTAQASRKPTAQASKAPAKKPTHDPISKGYVKL